MATRSEIFDTENVLHLIRILPVLWDISCEEYSRKTKKQDVWLEVCREMYEGFDILKWAKETRFVTIIDILIYLHLQYNFIAQLRGDTRNSELIK